MDVTLIARLYFQQTSLVVSSEQGSVSQLGSICQLRVARQIGERLLRSSRTALCVALIPV
ncbi:hypothetical protein J6590_101804 [Homalodisca vitripennis]|nr:hypothetical protein J6590_101804 [Homalodisca vitripennis]